MHNPLTKLAMAASIASASMVSARDWMSVPDRSIPCNFPRSREEIKRKHKADKARKAAKKARRRNRRK